MFPETHIYDIYDILNKDCGILAFFIHPGIILIYGSLPSPINQNIKVGHKLQDRATSSLRPKRLESKINYGSIRPASQVVAGHTE